MQMISYANFSLGGVFSLVMDNVVKSVEQMLFYYLPADRAGVMHSQRASHYLLD